MEEAKTMKTPMSSSIKLDKDEKGLWYPKGDNFELIGFSDANFASCKVERKSTSGTCHFLGHSLVSWHRLSHLSLSKWRLAKRREYLPHSQHSFSWTWCMSPRFGPLCQDLSLERLFRGCADLRCLRDGPSSHDLLHLIATRRTLRQGLLSGGFHSGLHSNGETNSCRVSDDDAYDILLETNFEAPTSYDTYDEQSLGRTKFEKTLDGSGLGELSDLQHRPRDRDRCIPDRLTQRDHHLSHLSPSFLTQRYHLRHLTLLIMHLGWIFERIEEHMDQQQATVEHFQQSIERIESRQVSQHEEMMAYLRSVFPPPPPQP
ncbi:hypothetical protein AAG906_022559 [Vitis piasezkii]